jgi:hypothetical protein
VTDEMSELSFNKVNAFDIDFCLTFIFMAVFIQKQQESYRDEWLFCIIEVPRSSELYTGEGGC